MAIRVVRLGTPRARSEGVRLGTVRRPPRGVKKRDFGRLDYFDIWTPELAPSDLLMKWAHADPFTDKRWAVFARRYRREMSAPAAQRLIALLASFSHTTDFSVGCYCERESRCHRSLLRALLADAGGTITVDPKEAS
jgi:uncharacterized protein YeaO (DUF488 family)